MHSSHSKEIRRKVRSSQEHILAIQKRSAARYGMMLAIRKRSDARCGAPRNTFWLFKRDPTQGAELPGAHSGYSKEIRRSYSGYSKKIRSKVQSSQECILAIQKRSDARYGAPGRTFWLFKRDPTQGAELFWLFARDPTQGTELPGMHSRHSKAIRRKVLSSQEHILAIQKRSDAR
jgi:hypothetical protein